MLKFFRSRRYPNRNVQFSDRKLVQNSIRNSRISLDNFLLNPQPTKSVIADEWDAATQFQDEENALAPLVVEAVESPPKRPPPCETFSGSFSDIP